MAESIRVMCKNCNKASPMEDFALDNVFRMIVCKNCTKARRLRENVHAEVAKQKEERMAKGAADEEEKPPGWDKEDEAINRAYRQKMAETVKVERADQNRVKYSCPKCKYKFLYNIERRTPSSCPYCGAGISRMQL